MTKSARRSDARGGVRDESWSLIHVASAWEAVVPNGPNEIAELIGCAPEDLTTLPFGIKSKMWMSRSAQHSSIALNKPASHALHFAGLSLSIRGPVVVHHERVDWEEEKRAERKRITEQKARRSQLAS